MLGYYLNGTYSDGGSGGGDTYVVKGSGNTFSGNGNSLSAGKSLTSEQYTGVGTTDISYTQSGTADSVITKGMASLIDSALRLSAYK